MGTGPEADFSWGSFRSREDCGVQRQELRVTKYFDIGRTFQKLRPRNLAVGGWELRWSQNQHN